MYCFLYCRQLTGHLLAHFTVNPSRFCTLSGVLDVLTLRLLTHLKEYLHFLDFHLPLPQLFLPGALAVLVGVSGRSALVPLSTLTASSCNQQQHKQTCYLMQNHLLNMRIETRTWALINKVCLMCWRHCKQVSCLAICLTLHFLIAQKQQQQKKKPIKSVSLPNYRVSLNTMKEETSKDGCGWPRLLQKHSSLISS